MNPRKFCVVIVGERNGGVCSWGAHILAYNAPAAVLVACQRAGIMPVTLTTIEVTPVYD